MTENNDNSAAKRESSSGAAETQLDERSSELLAARQEFLQIFKRGAEFTEELLKENERLRYRLADLEARVNSEGNDESLVKELMEKVRRLEQERQTFLDRVAEVEAQNKDYSSRYAEIENENNNLLNIYVASYQLHSTLDFREVLQIITEIILNFVGASSFVVALSDERTGEMKALVEENMEEVEGEIELSTADAVIGQVVENGEPYFTDELETKPPESKSPVAGIPLKIKERVIGLIAIYAFLPQKKRLAHVDHELFTLLAGHAATAIFSAKLYTESKRKLNTIQGLIDLVTSG